MSSEHILSLLGLSLRGSRLAVGEEPVEAAARARNARVLLLASDAADNTRRRCEHFAEAGDCLWLRLPFTKEELGRALGRNSVAIVALTDIGLASTVVRRLAELDPVRYDEAAARLDVKAKRAAERRSELAAHEKNLRSGKRRPKAAPAPQAEPVPEPPAPPAPKPQPQQDRRRPYPPAGARPQRPGGLRKPYPSRGTSQTEDAGKGSYKPYPSKGKPGETDGPGKGPYRSYPPKGRPGETGGPGKGPYRSYPPKGRPGETGGPGKGPYKPYPPKGKPGETGGTEKGPWKPRPPRGTSGRTGGPGKGPYKSRPSKDNRPKPKAAANPFAHSHPVKKGKGSFRKKEG